MIGHLVLKHMARIARLAMRVPRACSRTMRLTQRERQQIGSASPCKRAHTRFYPMKVSSDMPNHAEIIPTLLAAAGGSVVLDMTTTNVLPSFFAALANGWALVRCAEPRTRIAVLVRF